MHTHPIFKYNPLVTEEDKKRFIAELNVAEAAGVIDAFAHPEKPYLVGYDYTKKCTYDNCWKDFPVAIFCRGFVWNHKTNKIAALPFPKFRNLGEPACDISEKELMESLSIGYGTKVDGSFGIIFYDEGFWHVMTRGSFVSEQCQTAQHWIIQQNFLKKDNTYLAEIIYPANRIVVDYNGYTGFIFFGCYNKEDGTYFDVDTTLIKNCLNQTEFMNIDRYVSSFDDLKNVVQGLSGNEEGFVVVLKDGRRCKLKGDKYCELHKAKFGMSPLSVWENMVNGSVEHSRMLVPEEFRGTYDGYLSILENNKMILSKEYLQKMAEVSLRVGNITFVDEKTNRKNFAMEVLKLDKKYHGFCFAGYKGDGPAMVEMIMELIRPDGNNLTQIEA